MCTDTGGLDQANVVINKGKRKGGGGGHVYVTEWGGGDLIKIIALLHNQVFIQNKKNMFYHGLYISCSFHSLNTIRLHYAFC